MDTFITIISWIAGFYLAFILLLAIGFSAGGAAQTKKTGLGITSMLSTLFFLYLVYIGFSAIFGSDDKDDTNQIKSEKSVSIKHTQ